MFTWVSSEFGGAGKTLYFWKWPPLQKVSLRVLCIELFCRCAVNRKWSSLFKPPLVSHWLTLASKKIQERESRKWLFVCYSSSSLLSNPSCKKSPLLLDDDDRTPSSADSKLFLLPEKYIMDTRCIVMCTGGLLLGHRDYHPLFENCKLSLLPRPG